jgi:2-octaprenyl-6-methoxyphenol hydroxylase
MEPREASSIAVVGAGPAGLALALLAAQSLPRARITLHDARPLEQDVSADPRTLALSLGSVQLLERLQAWPAQAAQPLRCVHVSQAPPSWDADAVVRIEADELGVPMLGAVVAYGHVVAALQAAWRARAQAEPARLRHAFGCAVRALKPVAGGVEIDAGTAEVHDLAVVAEGGVFAEQARKAVTREYRQAAWVGTVWREGAAPGTAFERFTRHGPVALLPLPPDASGPPGRTALVWCVPSADDPVQGLAPAQRAALLNTLLPAAAGRVTEVGPLKRFELGLNAERTLVQGRVVRIGNAAQTLHPVAGQGLNLGLRDAHALVQALARAQGAASVGGRSIDAALRAVEWQRAPDRWGMIATTDFLARSFTWHWPGVGAARGLALAALQAVPPLKTVLARHLMFGRR